MVASAPRSAGAGVGASGSSASDVWGADTGVAAADAAAPSCPDATITAPLVPPAAAGNGATNPSRDATNAFQPPRMGKRYQDCAALHNAVSEPRHRGASALGADALGTVGATTND